jgi:hypothetical protein
MGQTVILVAYGEYGRRVGESHHRSLYPDALVEKMRDMREFDHLTYSEISRRTGVNLRSVAMICTYMRRNCRVDHYKKVIVEVPDEDARTSRMTTSEREQLSFTWGGLNG